MTTEPSANGKKASEPSNSKKSAECEKCKLDCKYKGKRSLPKVQDLLEVSVECYYRKELKQLGESISSNLVKHQEAINRAALSLASFTPVGLSYQNQIKAVAELGKYYQQQMMAVAQTYNRMYQNMPLFEKAIALQYQAMQPALQLMRDTARATSITMPQYFTRSEVQVLNKPVRIPAKSVANELIERLKSCPKGKDGWTEYQNVCKDILAYLLVPPLMGPFEQTPTEKRLQIRDLIFDIPYAIQGFWGYIRDRFDSSAIIVECKDYELPIAGNQFVTTSKYFGGKRLGRFGIILSREPSVEPFHGEMKRIWNSETNALILPFTDEHLIRMLSLKELNKEPELVIDAAIHQFLRSLE